MILLNVAHALQLITLFFLAFFILYKALFSDSWNPTFSCGLDEFFAFQMIVLSSFLFFWAVVISLERRVNQIEILTKLDQKINFQY